MAATYSSLVGIAIGGKYEIRRVIGAGGMGVVCEAIHTDLGKKVAIKLIDKSMKETQLIVERFKREARALGQIQSEHIVTVFDVGADPRLGLYMVMEILTGEDLQRRLEREKKLEVKTAVMIAHQVARGLAKAHAAGVIHRDLKPANVFLTQRDNGQLLVKLLDFGVSKLLHDETGGARITGSGAPIGTPLYMCPEQAEGKDDIDGRADVWSLGAVLYEALAGAPPFADRGSYHGTIVGILTSRPKLLHDAAPWVPSELAKAVDAMLVHDRDARIASAETVTQRLLEAYPAVLPDGTGRHTAVIVPSSDATADATGDTEIFNSDSVPPEMRRRRTTGAPSSNPGSGKPISSDRAPSSEVSSAGRTGAATPVGPSTGEDFKSTKRMRGPKTVPIAPPASPSSSSRGVAMPGTPPNMEPLPMSAVPDTTRDEELAIRADRRRWLSILGIAAAVIGVAVGGYFAGRRSQSVVAPPPVTATAPSASAPAAPPSAAATATATATASATAPAPAASESAPPAPKPLPRKIRLKAPETPPAASSAAPAPPSGIETVPPY